MIYLLIILLINSLVCFGFWNACLYMPEDKLNDTQEIKGVLWFIEKWAKDKWFYKPLCHCLPCMASFHSTYVYWGFMFTLNSITWSALIIYPIYILALSGLNYILNELL